MNVFEFVHLSYCWEDNDYDLTSSEIFETYEDATTYYEIVRDKIVSEYINEANVNNLKEFEADDEYNYYNESEYSKSEPKEYPEKEAFYFMKEAGYPYLYISIDEYGSDTLMIRKKAIMKFC